MNGCPKFTVNECKKHYKSKLDTVTVKADLSKTGKLKFLIDTGAEISVVKGTSLKPEFSYESTEGINIKGISNSLLKTEGTARLKLVTPTHETTHVFHVMGINFSCHYDGILGHDFWKNDRATINYCDRTITMDDVIMSFDNEANKTHKLSLKPRTESTVQLPTKSTGLGIISKREIIPGVYLTQSFRKLMDIVLLA